MHQTEHMTPDQHEISLKQVQQISPNQQNIPPLPLSPDPTVQAATAILTDAMTAVPSSKPTSTGSPAVVRHSTTIGAPPTLGSNAEDYMSTSLSHYYREEDEKIIEYSPSGRYGKINCILGKGAYKVVWKAIDLEEGLEVAWNCFQVREGKAVRRNEFESYKSCSRKGTISEANISSFLPSTTKQESTEFMQEIEILKKVRHPNIIGFKDSWFANGEFVFVSELMNSVTLREYMKKIGKPSLKIIKSWTRQILKGLLYLHSHQPPIIHRDIKCDNLFINGAHGEVKIGDMGTAKMKFGKKYTVIGTPEFMAPEMYEEKGYSEKVDVYAFGMCLLELVTGEYPYAECKNAAQIYKKVSAGIKPDCLQKVEDEEIFSLISNCIAPEQERFTVKQVFEHPFYVCEPDVLLLSVDEQHYILTLQVVFRENKNRMCVKFEYTIESDSPEQVVNEMIHENVLPECHKSLVVNEIYRVVREFHIKFPFAMEVIQRNAASQSTSSLDALGKLELNDTDVKAEKTPAQSINSSYSEGHLSTSPTSRSWRRDLPPYRSELLRAQKEMTLANERALEAEKKAKEMAARIKKEEDRHNETDLVISNLMKELNSLREKFTSIASSSAQSQGYPSHNVSSQNSSSQGSSIQSATSHTSQVAPSAMYHPSQGYNRVSQPSPAPGHSYHSSLNQSPSTLIPQTSQPQQQPVHHHSHSITGMNNGQHVGSYQAAQTLPPQVQHQQQQQHVPVQHQQQAQSQLSQLHSSPYQQLALSPPLQHQVYEHVPQHQAYEHSQQVVFDHAPQQVQYEHHQPVQPQPIYEHFNISDDSLAHEPVASGSYVIDSNMSIEDFVYEVAQLNHRGPEKAQEWLAKLRQQDIQTLSDLKELHEEDWTNLSLTVFASRALRNALTSRKSAIRPTSSLSTSVTTHHSQVASPTSANNPPLKVNTSAVMSSPPPPPPTCLEQDEGKGKMIYSDHYETRPANDEVMAFHQHQQHHYVQQQQPTTQQHQNMMMNMPMQQQQLSPPQQQQHSPPQQVQPLSPPQSQHSQQLPSPQMQQASYHGHSSSLSAPNLVSHHAAHQDGAASSIHSIITSPNGI